MEFKFKRKVLKLDIYGQVVESRQFNAEELHKYQSEIEKVEDPMEVLNVIYKHLDKVGIKKEIAREMSTEDLNDLLAIVCGVKKK